MYYQYSLWIFFRQKALLGTQFKVSAYIRISNIRTSRCTVEKTGTLLFHNVIPNDTSEKVGAVVAAPGDDNTLHPTGFNTSYAINLFKNTSSPSVTTRPYTQLANLNVSTGTKTDQPDTKQNAFRNWVQPQFLTFVMAFLNSYT